MSELARKRWQLLGEALSNRHYLVNNELISASVRRFSSFGLLSAEPCLPDESRDDAGRVCHLRPAGAECCRSSGCREKEMGQYHTEIVHSHSVVTLDNLLGLNNSGNVYDGCKWYTYTCLYCPDFKAAIRHVDSVVTLDNLLGFDNTGNVCVWPSEEVLTYYCLRNSDQFSKKNVCELGGGMTCLAAVAVATSSDASEVFLTDGNELSVSNLEHIVSKNQASFQCNNVHAGMLRWGKDIDLGMHKGYFDCIISADCLFFDEGRSDLASMIFNLLKPEGEALILAPRRGETFQQFVEIAASMSFCSTVTQIYDEVVWNLHLQNVVKGVDVYDETLHYPWLLRLTKSDSVS